MKPGDIVEWTKDYRPYPDHLPKAYEEAAWDMSLVVKERGTLIKISRTFWGRWVALVEFKNQFKEIDVDQLKKGKINE